MSGHEEGIRPAWMVVVMHSSCREESHQLQGWEITPKDAIGFISSEARATAASHALPLTRICVCRRDIISTPVELYL